MTYLHGNISHEFQQTLANYRTCIISILGIYIPIYIWQQGSWINKLDCGSNWMRWDQCDVYMCVYIYNGAEFPELPAVNVLKLWNMCLETTFPLFLYKFTTFLRSIKCQSTDSINPLIMNALDLRTYAPIRTRFIYIITHRSKYRLQRTFLYKLGPQFVPICKVSL